MWRLAVAGSSPHTRGLRGRATVPHPGRRIIPAHAGFTPRAYRPAACTRDHPRTRGVYKVPPVGRGRFLGSSPHTRGLLMEGSNMTATKGIIPAHAGFTGAGAGGRDVAGDHPRTRGVYGLMTVIDAQRNGSSPHTRGLRRPARLEVGQGGIIPAHAGFTRDRPRSARATRDHPRTRGVY